MSWRNKSLAALIFFTVTFTAACSPTSVPAAPSEAPAAASPTFTPEPTATPTPPRSLVVCLGQEPRTLFSYKGSSRSMWTVLEGIYDGPIDTHSSGPQPIIVEKIPSFADGDALITPVDIKAGDEVVDADGDLVILAGGERLLPSGCFDQSCAAIWDGKTPLKLDQLSLSYRLRQGITWSDGTPLTAQDSVFSFDLSRSPDIPVAKALPQRTSTYEALDEVTVKWTGKPGYVPARFDSLFWAPMPKHAWGSISPKELLDSEQANERPLGWGPFVVSDWVKGDHITLVRNDKYFRAQEGLPNFDQLVFRFLGEPADNNMEALLSGECDVVDQTSLLEEQLEPILELQRDKKLKAYIAQGPEWEQVNFGIKPVSYDDGYNAFAGDRPDFFSDLRMRQAFASCMNRTEFLRKPLENQTSIPVGFYPEGHPYFLPDVQPLPFDPQAGIKLLEEVGWKELDGDPNTPRTAVAIAGVADGTPLAVNYLTTKAPLRVEAARQLSASLMECGIQVNVQYLSPAELYAPGPDGPLFGRKFDLAEFGWEAGVTPPCWLYQSDQVPDQRNNWLGVNVTGYINPAYDSACLNARQARADQPDFTEKQLAAQRLFAQELPSIPLYFRLKMAISRTDFCGLELDPSARSLLWNLEVLDSGPECNQ